MYSGLKKSPAANANVRKEGSTTILRSYNTDVAAIVKVNNTRWLVVFGLHSNTTRKHISYFVDEYAGVDYYQAKAAYENNYAYNVDTGEVRNLDWFVHNYFHVSHYNYSSRGFHVYAK